ncbi:energy-coupling factor transporter transmembrane protein EcfT [cf. Phormidesmis sp. LEGE 11477]|uniref:energy-coupling factor transporter transmembrane component T family protein n=1 Tax=cf. Phormidesmis sp. LEGE 11477 TaxID=1828680 RepID=UPI001882710B|nr:energy-coupling factor transporter transmembrane component T [cf. Phormidesmis sp. LEGE 11477]MBE9064880.1 energy-coupling factor transporter transmembrane protein EcfT [cf. Phormidesmis sp. LEGE 11477]
MLTSAAGSSRHSKRGWLWSVNPLLKIVLSLVAVAVAFALQNLAAAGLLVGVLLALLLTVGMPWRLWLTGAIAILLFTALTWLLRDGPAALLNTLRLLAILLPGPLFSLTTSPADLTRALQAVKLPSFLVLSLMLVWRFLPVIQQEAQRIIEANQLRGVDLGRRPRQWFSGLFVPLIFRIVSYADEVTVGLETRSYDPNAHRSMGQPLRWRRLDSGVAIAAILIFCAVGHLQWSQ